MGGASGCLALDMRSRRRALQSPGEKDQRGDGDDIVFESMGLYLLGFAF